MFSNLSFSNYEYSSLILFSGIILVLAAGVSCTSTKQAAQTEVEESALEPDEAIEVNINDIIHYEFQKYDSAWTGNLTTFALNEEGKKVVQAEMSAAEDSTWNDFDDFVDFLDIYNIPPQHEIDGWAPNSSELPQRVYSFKVFDGDTTRTFSYQDPENDVRDFWQAQNVALFATFILQELRWVQTMSQ